jgi:hypothetical protein
MPVANGLMKSIAAAKELSPLKKDMEDKLKLSQQVSVLPPV